MARARCIIVFEPARKGGPSGPAAIMYSMDGRALNAVNYPSGTSWTAKLKARARRRLMPGCAELSRTVTLGGARRRKRRR